LRETYRYIGVLCDPNVLVSGLAASDGSLCDGTVRPLARSAWGFAVWSESDRAIVGAAAGPVPGMLHEILRAEVWALWQLLRKAIPPLMVVIDNLEVVRGLARGRAYCCSAARPHADVWVSLWDVLDGLGPFRVAFSVAGLGVGSAGSELLFAWFGSHQKEAEVASAALPFFWANKAADKIAKQSCKQVRVVKEVRDLYHGTHSEILRAAKFVGCVLAGLSLSGKDAKEDGEAPLIPSCVLAPLRVVPVSPDAVPSEHSIGRVLGRWACQWCRVSVASSSAARRLARSPCSHAFGSPSDVGDNSSTDEVCREVASEKEAPRQRPNEVDWSAQVMAEVQCAFDLFNTQLLFPSRALPLERWASFCLQTVFPRSGLMETSVCACPP
jgi:hypothetical protein